MILRRVPWLAAGATLAIAVGMMAGRLLAAGRLGLPSCPLKALTGWPCATCGMTRWLQALGGADWAAAFHWHPVATVALALLPVACLWDLRRAWRGDPWPSLPDHPWARGLAWSLLLGTWLLQAVRGI